jgi:DnaJ homolog subfamily C member 2
MSFVFGVPPASATTRVLASVKITGTIQTALPIGKEALKKLGGKEKDVVAAKGDESAFPEDKIVIPVGITPQNLKNYTLYDVLGFSGEWGAAADTEVIKKAYHKAVLMYHPDKAQYKTEDGKEDRTVFLKIQEAFAVLCSEPKRRAYDSQLPFDESIPTDDKIQKGLAKGPHKFFKIFGPVFQRNARFAQQKPVPDLGDMDTPMPQVYKFYQYWVKFESWRDFTGVGAEYKPDDAGSREEKRYMQKENERLAKKLKMKEMERLIALVAMAEKYDPRVVADKERRKSAKESDKNAKESAAKKRAEDDAAAKAWSEEQDAQANEGTSKADKEKIKKAISKCRNILRKLLRFSAAAGQGSGEYGILTDSEVELICANCSMEDLNQLNEAMGGEPASKDAALLRAEGFPLAQKKVEVARAKSQYAVEDEAIAKDAKKRELEDKMKGGGAKKPTAAQAAAAVEEREWTEAELEALKMCLVRYPAGQANRWVNICNYINVKLNPAVSYSPEDTLRMAYLVSK